MLSPSTIFAISIPSSFAINRKIENVKEVNLGKARIIIYGKTADVAVMIHDITNRFVDTYVMVKYPIRKGKENTEKLRAVVQWYNPVSLLI